MNWAIGRSNQAGLARLPSTPDPKSFNRTYLKGLNRNVEPMPVLATPANTHLRRKQTDRIGNGQTKGSMQRVTNPKDFNRTYLKGDPGHSEPMARVSSKEHSIETLHKHFGIDGIEAEQHPKESISILLQNAQLLASKATTPATKEMWQAVVALAEQWQQTADKAQRNEIVAKIVKATGQNVSYDKDGDLVFDIFGEEEKKAVPKEAQPKVDLPFILEQNNNVDSKYYLPIDAWQLLAKHLGLQQTQTKPELISDVFSQPGARGSILRKMLIQGSFHKRTHAVIQAMLTQLSLEEKTEDEPKPKEDEPVILEIELIQSRQKSSENRNYVSVPVVTEIAKALGIATHSQRGDSAPKKKKKNDILAEIWNLKGDLKALAFMKDISAGKFKGPKGQDMTDVHSKRIKEISGSGKRRKKRAKNR